MKRKNICLAHLFFKVKFRAKVSQKVNQKVKARIKKDIKRKILTSLIKLTWRIDKNKTETGRIKLYHR
jgi:hypothetical protein